MKRIGITAVVLLCARTLFAQAATENIVHQPINEVLEGEVRLEFTVPGKEPNKTIVLRVAAEGARPAFEVPVQRFASGYQARIAAGKVAPPGFSYFVVERMPDGSEQPLFADVEHPHRVHVLRPPQVEAELERLERRDGQRSSMLLSGEVVDFGDRRLTAQSGVNHDRYYRLEAGYAYSFLTLIEDVQLSLVRVRGQAADYEVGPPPVSSATAPGIDYGRAAVTLHASDAFRLRASVLLGASQRGFEYGAGGSLVLGDPRATQLDTGVEAMTTLGVTVHMRLGFLASERVPMGASVEVTTFPLGDDAGVRLLYDVGYRFGAVTMLMLRGGYQGRTSVRGGPSAMLAFDYGF